jgi:hypothetical protein
MKRTKSGLKCQDWTSQEPHEHDRTPEEYPERGLGDHNRCRNPDDVEGIWCYTTDPETRWDWCDELLICQTKYRGFNVLVINKDEEVMINQRYDTYTPEGAEEFEFMLSGIPDGSTFAMVVSVNAVGAITE